MVTDEIQRRRQQNIERSLYPLKEYFDDTAVTDIYSNSDGKLWVKRFGSRKEWTGSLTEEEKRKIVTSVTDANQRLFTREHPVFSGDIPGYNARLEAIGPPRTKSISIVIRRKDLNVLSLTDWVNDGRITNDQANQLKSAIKRRKTMVIIGGTGSGKTKLLNTIIREIAEFCPDLRLYIVEDTREINCYAEDYELVFAASEKAGEAVRSALRFFPDIIIFGELRYPDSVIEFLMSLNSGHKGSITTIHANSAVDGLHRLHSLAKQTVNGEFTIEEITRVIDLCLYMESSPVKGPILKEILDIKTITSIHKGVIK